MRQEVQLFLNGKEVYFSKDPKINFVYQRTELTNPSVVKNLYTKTVKVEGTPENNKVFNGIWNLERMQDFSDSTYFNPSKRVPFELFQNGDLIEQGYAKLDNITRQGRKISYDITLFGGIGDFFYGLSYCENTDSLEGGRDLTLADLTFREELDDNTYGDEIDLDFDINKQTVKSAWEAIPGTTYVENKWKVVNFIPAYNGYPENMDTDKVLIDAEGTEDTIIRQIKNISTVELSGFPKMIKENGDVTTDESLKKYGLYEGFALAELNGKMTEWEIRDLRSWCQRPAMSVKGLFNGICNSTKYKVVLDEDFFNANNHYYEDAWFTLPMLSELDNTSESITATPTIDLTHKESTTDYRFRLDTQASLHQGVSDVKVKFRPTVIFNGWSDNTANDAEHLYPSFWPSGTFHRVYGGLTAQLIGYDGSNSPVCASDIIYMTNYATHGKSTKTAMLSDTNFQNIYGGTVKYDFGQFNHVSTTPVNNNIGEIVTLSDDMFPTEGSGNTGEIVVDPIDPEIPAYAVVSEFKWCRDFTLTLDTKAAEVSYVVLRMAFVTTGKSKWQGTLSTSSGKSSVYLRGTAINEIKPKYLSGSITVETPDDVMSGAHVTKKKLLSTINGTPCDYLLSYCKLFNLYFEKDLYSDIIYIKHRSNYYDGKVIDISNDIDRGKDMKITPIVFDKKYYTFNYDNSYESEHMETYKKNNGVEFGTMKVDTGYNFDVSTEDLLDGTVFKNGIQIDETSRYYRYITTSFDDPGLPAFMFGGSLKYKLFNTKLEDKEITLSYPELYIDQQISDYGEYFDVVDKLQLHETGNKAMDGSGVLCFFNGFKDVRRWLGRDIQGNDVYSDFQYRLTDDVQTMIDLNGKPCWMYTNRSTYGIKMQFLPYFSRYTSMTGDDGTNIGMAWDFSPSASFMPNYRYSSKSTVYARYWKDYISDLYNANTRVVTAYVNLKGKVNSDMLKHFYWFDNSLWILNKITDYNITSFDTTKCEFIKVIDKTDYLKRLSMKPYFVITLRNTDSIPASGGTVIADVYLSSAGNYYIEDSPGDIEADPTSYSGGNEYSTVTLTIEENTGEPRDLTVGFFALDEWDTSGNVTVHQDGINASSIVVSKSAGTIPGDGGTNSLYVVCNGDWTLTSDSIWCTFRLPGSTLASRTMTGSGSTRVDAVVEANNTSSSRNIVITGTSGTYTNSTTLTQQAGSYRYLNLNQNECISCNACDGMLDPCPIGLAVTFDSENYAYIANLSSCIGCGACNFGASNCPMNGLAMYSSDVARNTIMARTITDNVLETDIPIEILPGDLIESGGLDTGNTDVEIAVPEVSEP